PAVSGGNMLTQGNVVEPYSNCRSESRGLQVRKMVALVSQSLTDASKILSSPN
ncbi:hypothetical protein WH47_07113, partial [Habropoda laboriosa]